MEWGTQLACFCVSGLEELFALSLPKESEQRRRERKERTSEEGEMGRGISFVSRMSHPG